MNASTKDIALYGIIAVFATLAGFFIVKTYRLSGELDEAMQKTQLVELQTQQEVRIRTIDSLLMSGKYTQALEAYNQALSNDSLVTRGEIEMRIDLTRQFISMQNELHTSRAGQSDSVTADTLQVTVTATPEEIRAYDSLRFELEKKQVQINHLKRELGNKAVGTYITFKSRKGNHIHYVGEVQEGKANGRGIALLNTGSRYVGQWKDNMRHGEGTFYWPDGEYYVGNYHNDIRHGQGTYYWPSGEKYVGEWRNDMRNGIGTFYGEEGEVVAQGKWKNDELVEVEKRDNGRN